MTILYNSIQQGNTTQWCCSSVAWMRNTIAELGATLHPHPAEGGYLTLHDAGNSTWHLEWVKDNAVCHTYIPDSMTREAPEGRSLT